ncbi:MAG: hypothetical protein Q4G05_02710 [Clostridia bacterium]|nr:hypothetical protein [Clostridia bacterium]
MDNNNKSNNMFCILKSKKENLIRSLNEVEKFLIKTKRISKSIQLYNIFKH